MPAITPEPDGLSSSPVELAVVTRDGMIESRHFGSAVVLGPNGSSIIAVGEKYATFYPRSALKPLQAEGVFAQGLKVSSELLAIGCGSHIGTPSHVALVTALLQDAGLRPSDLQCPSALPAGLAARDEALQTGKAPSPLFHNCSGKHALFLAACVVNDWSTVDYLDREHPLHVAILRSIASSTGEQIVHVGVDGCGAPAPAMSIEALAIGIRRIALGEDASRGRIANAMLRNAWAVGGAGNPDTVIMEQLGFVAKVGAEGIMVVATPSGYSVALKVSDGSLRAAGAIALSLLAQATAVDPDISARVTHLLTEPVLGGSVRVGEIRATVDARPNEPSGTRPSPRLE